MPSLINLAFESWFISPSVTVDPATFPNFDTLNICLTSAEPIIFSSIFGFSMPDKFDFIKSRYPIRLISNNKTSSQRSTTKKTQNFLVIKLKNAANIQYKGFFSHKFGCAKRSRRLKSALQQKPHGSGSSVG